MSTRRQYQIACGFLCAAFAGLSLARSLHKPFWRDEVVSVFASKGTLARAFEIGRGDSSGLLFNPILHFWIGLAGSDTQLLRALPLFFALATVLLMQWRAYRWLHPLDLKRSLALAALSLNTVLLFYSAELRNQTLFIFLATLLILSTEQFLSGKTRWLAMLLLSAALAIISNPLGIVLVGCVALVLAAVAISRGHWKWIGAGSVLAALALVIFSPLIRTMLAHAAELRRYSWITFGWVTSLPEARGVFAPFDQVTYERRPINLLTAVGVFLCLLGILQMRRDRYQRGPAWFLGIAAAAAPLFVLATYFASSFLAPIFFRRYLACACTSFAAVMLLGYSHRLLRNRLLFAAVALAHAAAVLWIFFILLWPVSEFEYATLAQLEVPVFDGSQFDILPCAYYAPSCTFVGKPDQIDRTIGAYWFNDRLAFAGSWSEIRAPEIATLIRPDSRAEVTRELTAIGYRPIGAEVAGDQVLLLRWSKKSPPTTDPADLHK